MRDWLALTGRPALVVGAGGLGGASALSLAAQGASVVLVDVDEDNLESVAKAAKEAGGEVQTLRRRRRARPTGAGPPSTRPSRRSARLEIFLHAVGRNVRRPVLDLGDDDWERPGHPQPVHRVLARARRSAGGWSRPGYGRMVFVSSVSGLLAHPHHAPYAATKGGINQLLRVMAREWASAGVTVNAVAPGYIETDLTRDYLDQDGNREALESLVPAGRLGRPEEVADAVTFLASDRAGFITGHVLYVDGGRMLV